MTARWAEFRLYRGARVARAIGPAMLRYRALERADASGTPPDLAAWDRAHERTAVAIAALGEDLGGLFIKLCQVAGARADVFPPVFQRELGRFHDRVTPRPFAELAPALERDLGRPLAEVFESVEPEALAAASLAQVHGARLRDGTRVVLKIQYPNARRLFTSDLGNVRRAVRAASWVISGFPFRAAIEEVADQIAHELDFAREARSLSRVRAAFAADPSVCIPRLYPELSSARLLVLERLDGTPIHELDKLRGAGVDLRALADQVARAYRAMIFEHGFFHGDPHPGNLLVLPDGRLGVLDFGLAKELPPGFGANVLGMFAAVFAGDPIRALACARALGFAPDAADPATFVKAIGIALGAKLGLAELQRTLETGLRGGTPPDVALVIRTFVLLNGLSERLAPGERRIARALVGV